MRGDNRLHQRRIETIFGRVGGVQIAPHFIVQIVGIGWIKATGHGGGANGMVNHGLLLWTERVCNL